MKAQDILIPAIRQYQHNDCSGFVTGLDYAETIKIVEKLQNTSDEYIKGIVTSWISSLDTTTDGFDTWWNLNKYKFLDN